MKFSLRLKSKSRTAYIPMSKARGFSSSFGNTIRLNMASPLLVIEIVSPGEIQRDRDYIAKRMQYQDCCIPEYWIVDPQTQTILVLELVANSYETVGNFSKDDLVQSSGFRQLNLKVSDIWNSHC